MKTWLIPALIAALMLSFACDDPAEDAAEAIEEEAAELEGELDDMLDDMDDEADAEVDDETADETADADDVATPDDDGLVVITATQMGFEPSRIEAPAGQEVTLRFEREVEQTCMDNVVFEDQDIEADIPLDEPYEVSFTLEEGEVINYACDMGMGESTLTGV